MTGTGHGPSEAPPRDIDATRPRPRPMRGHQDRTTPPPPPRQPPWPHTHDRALPDSLSALQVPLLPPELGWPHQPKTPRTTPTLPAQRPAHPSDLRRCTTVRLLHFHPHAAPSPAPQPAALHSGPHQPRRVRNRMAGAGRGSEPWSSSTPEGSQPDRERGGAGNELARPHQPRRVRNPGRSARMPRWSSPHQPRRVRNVAAISCCSKARASSSTPEGSQPLWSADLWGGRASSSTPEGSQPGRVRVPQSSRQQVLINPGGFATWPPARLR